jgi:hypothetical protein
MMGPAYGEAMLRLFANPDEPELTRSAYAMEQYMGYHPPEHLRMLMVFRTLSFLGQNTPVRKLRARWDQLHHHQVKDQYWLPAADETWAVLSADYLNRSAEAVVDRLLNDAWPPLDGTRLINIPGVYYTHGNHARVQEMTEALRYGETVAGEARLIIAAGVLAAAEGGVEGLVLSAVQDSVIGIGTGERRGRKARHRHRDVPAHPRCESLIEMVSNPRNIAAAITIAEAIRDRRRKVGL